MIRPLSPDDTSDLLPLIAALAAHHGDRGRPSAVTLRRDIEDGWLWGFGTGSPLTGYALVHPVPRAQSGTRGVELHHLYVAPEARRRGLARALIGAVEEDARARGCSFVRIGAVAGNDAARRIYEAAGYEMREVTFWRFRKDV